MVRKDSFAGRSIVITGAGGGIGSALARCFAREGARVGLLDLDSGSIVSLAKEISAQGGTALAVRCDVTSWESVRDAVGEVLTAHGGVDVLVANAGITQLGFFRDMDVEVIRRVMEVNFFGAVHCVKAALPSLLERRGQIVALSSIAGIAPLATRSGYSASKHAMQGFFTSLRAELRGSGVGVTLVCPSFVNTGIGDKALGGDGGKARIEHTETGTPVEPEEVAEAIVLAVGRRRRLLLPSRHAKLAYGVSRFFPALYERMMVKRIVSVAAREPDARPRAG